MREHNIHDKLAVNGLGEASHSIMLRMNSGAAASRPIECGSVKWSWACRHLITGDVKESYYVGLDNSKPRLGDVALVRVERIGHHGQLETANDRRLRLYPGDWLTCAFGNRYATDVYEARALGLEKLHLLTGGGMIGTVLSRHRDVGRPTLLSFLGYVADSSGLRVNLIDLKLPKINSPSPQPDVVLVVGTSMNAGKTTVTRKIVRGLIAQGVPVGACKLTGSVSPRDLYELRATGALHATDFSDYGFPSTYGASLPDLIRLFDNIMDACSRKGAQLVVVEVADGVLQPETQMLLECEEIRRRVSGVVLSAACSESALHAAGVIQRSGFDLWAVSGLITNSPLFLREFATRNPIPLASSHGRGDKLANVILKRIAAQRAERCAPVALTGSH